MMTTQKTAATESPKKGVLNRMFERFAFRVKFNRTSLNIQAADLLRQEIAAQNITQKAIAEKLDISQSRLSQILNTEEKNLTLNTISDIATVLEKRIKLDLVDDNHTQSITKPNSRIFIETIRNDWAFANQRREHYDYSQNRMSHH